MKKILSSLFVTLCITGVTYAQNPSMTISHSGLSPSSELTVYAGELIDFIYGGGGPHPMTENWQSGESSTPVEFETVTVTSSNPTATFSLDLPGTYYFHCGTNPGNSNNWGKIIVLDVNTSMNTEPESPAYSIYPNPVTNVLIIEDLDVKGELLNISGYKVMDINSSKVNVSDLPKGTYILRIGKQSSIIIKK